MALQSRSMGPQPFLLEDHSDPLVFKQDVACNYRLENGKRVKTGITDAKWFQRRGSRYFPKCGFKIFGVDGSIQRDPIFDFQEHYKQKELEYSGRFKTQDHEIFDKYPLLR